MNTFRPLAVGTYKPSPSFLNANEHIAVCFDDDETLVAVTGYADDPDNVVESVAYAKLFAAAPELLAALVNIINNVDMGDFLIRVAGSYDEPEHPANLDLARAAIRKATEPQ